MDKLSSARGVIRTSITKFISKIETTVLTDPDIKVEEVIDNIDILNEKEKDLNQLNSQIFEIIETKQVENEMNSVEKYKEDILLCRNKLKRLKLKITPEIVQPAQSVVARNTDSSDHTENNTKSISVKLPRLQMDSFDGNICEWYSFWNRFNISIHENKNLTNVEKFSYLKSYLTKDAANAIGGLSITDENYEKAIKILDSRFGRKDLIVDKHMSVLLHLAPCLNSKDIAALRKVYDSCELQINSLKGLDIDINSFGTLLFPVLIRALPNDIVLLFTREHGSEKNKITDLLEFLKKEVESRERAFVLTDTHKENIKVGNFVKPLNDRQNKFRSFDNNYRVKRQTTANLNVTTEKFCVFCDKLGDHVSDNCDCYDLNEKKNKLKQKGRCMSCYKKFHIKRNCRSKVECFVCHSKEHRKGLCDKIVTTENDSKITDSKTIVTSVIPNPKNEICNKHVLMSTFKAVIVTPDNKMKVRCLLDSGSERTFLRQQVCKNLKLPTVGKETINLHTFGSTNSVKHIRSKIQFKLCNVEDENKFVNIEALESPEICGALIEAPRGDFIEQILSLNIKLSDIVECNEDPQRIDVLIGSDYFWQIVTGRTKRVNPSLVLVETVMGWTAQGPVSQTPIVSQSTSVNALNAIISRDIEDEKLTSTYIKSFWELESVGIKDEIPKERISDDETYQNLKSNLSFKNNRYEVQLPWKHDSVNLNDNYFNARKRLDSLVRRFKNDPKLYADYKNVIEEYLRLGIVEAVDDKNEKINKPVFFLPHHPVIRVDKPSTQLRIVFDGSSHPQNSPSLNDLLHPGPNLNPDLLNLLLKFRLNYIAFIADVEKAFLMISLNENDRDVVRFLWIDKLPEDLSQIQPKILRLTRVLFGVTSSPFLLAGVIKSHLEKYSYSYPETFKMLNESMYVDDLLAGSPNEEEAFKRSEEAKLVMEEAGMTLRKWKSNSPSLEKRWENSKFEISLKEASQDKTVPLKVLGLIWDRHKDIFKFDVTDLIQFIENSDKTKRTVIRCAGRIFDPTGFLSPFSMKLKVLFQELWEKGIHWDEELPDDVARQWKIWHEELPLLNNLEIPRYCFGDTLLKNLKSIQIHCFTDSSEKAYGAVIYIRYTDANNDSSVMFFLSKGRLAPLKKLTIPRLELTAALIGARLIFHIKPIFQNSGIDVSYHCWTDSSISLGWIKGSPSKWKPYVANRVREIQSLTDPEIWNHCPGQTNPADLITRKRKLAELINSDLWWSGPTWLQKEKDWPKANHMEPDRGTLDLEARKDVSLKKHKVVACSVTNEHEIDLLHRFSSWTTLKRVTAVCLRFITKNTGLLTIEEIDRATLTILKLVQQQEFKEEIKLLKSGKNLNSNSRIISLNPFLDKDELLHVGGRLRNSNVSDAQKHQIILPKKHVVTDLIVKYYHEAHLHSGAELTIAAIRQKFWIVNAREAVKKNIKKCMNCFRTRANVASQIMADLPAARVLPDRVFSKVGIDLAGPFRITARKGRGVKSFKCYVCLYICFCIKAVHLEVVSDLSTEAFLASLKRFVARRGKPQEIFSDQGTNFIGADRELKRNMIKISSDEKLHKYLSDENIRWNFNPPAAPHFGGLWESGIKQMKGHLKRTIGIQILTNEEFTTLITQIEACLNSRPLVAQSSDPNDLSPLTPGHFLIGTALTAIPEPQTTRTNYSHAERWKLTQGLFQSFWKRWSTDYLSQLQQRPKWVKAKPNLQENDLVLIKDDNLPPLRWKLGRIIESYPGPDGRVRVVKLKTAMGELKRPIAKLSPLPD